MSQPQTPSIMHAGLDESGSLTSTAPFFVLAMVIVPHPEAVQNLIKRTALRSGKRLKRQRKAGSELKWRKASQRIRQGVLNGLAQTEATIFTLTVRKKGRRIEDNPENYAFLTCELLRQCWDVYPNVALSLDRHFTSPTQIAVVNTTIHRHWPTQGVLSIGHVDSQRSPLVQLADFVAGSVYDWYKTGDPTFNLIEEKVDAALVEDWQYVKARWLKRK